MTAPRWWDRLALTRGAMEREEARFRAEHRAAWEEECERRAALILAAAEARTSGDDALAEVLESQVGPPMPDAYLPPSVEWR